MKLKLKRSLLESIVNQMLKQGDNLPAVKNNNLPKVKNNAVANRGASSLQNAKAGRQLYNVIKQKLPQISTNNGGATPKDIITQLTKLLIMDTLGTFYGKQ